MSYSDYTLETVRHAFGLAVRDEALFAQVGATDPSLWLKETLQKGQDLAVTSEKARGEFIVAPVLMACRDIVGHQLRIYSGAPLNVAPEQGLKGECDYILARSESSVVFQVPLMVILEAKKHDIEEGLGQCAAQMVAAQMYNQREGSPVRLMYGCVTNGDSWQFLRLQDANLTLHTKRYSLDVLPAILWFLVECVREVDREVAAQRAA